MATVHLVDVQGLAEGSSGFCGLRLNSSVMASDTPKAHLISLHDKEGMTWREIADMKEYRGIPAGSLCSFAKGNWEPKDLITRRKLGIKEPELIPQYRNPLGQFERH